MAWSFTFPALFAQNVATMTPPPAAPGSILSNIAQSIAQGYIAPGSGAPGSWSPQSMSSFKTTQKSASAPQSPAPSAGGDSNSGMMVIKPEPELLTQVVDMSNGQKADSFFQPSPSTSPSSMPPLNVSCQCEAWTKWLTFGRRHFQTHFLDRNVLYFDWNFTEMCSKRSNWQLVSIDQDWFR